MVRTSKEGLKLVLLCVGVILLVSLGFSLVDDGSSSITGAIIGDSGPLAAQANQDSCATLNGDTEINDSITTSGGTCFVVNASHITINGQGNTITGANNDTAFELFNVTNVTILDLTLENFDYGFIVNLSDSTNISQISSSNINTTVFYLGGPSGGVHGNHTLADSTFDGGQIEAVRLNTTFESNFTNLTFTNQKVHMVLGVDSANNLIYNPSFSTADASFPGILDEHPGSFNDLQFEDTTAGKIAWQKDNLTITDQLAIGANIVIDAQGNDITLGLESSDELANLNSSATIDFYNQVYGTQPFVLKDGTRCDDTDACNVTGYSGGSLAVDVDSFSNFTTQSSITCGSVLNSNLNLDEDMYCNGTAFIVNGTDLTINGLGYAIYGNGSGYGINVTSGNFGAYIQNLTIDNFSRAVHVDGADGPLLTDLNLTVGQYSNGTAVVFIKDSNSPEVYNSTYSSAGDNTYAVYIENTESSVVTGNTISTSGANAHGVYLYDNSFSSTVSDNVISVSGTGAQAMRHETDSNEITASGNTLNASGTNSHGIFADATSNSQFTNNVIYISGANATGLNFSLGATMTIANNNFTSESTGTNHMVFTGIIVSATVSANRLLSTFADSTALYFESTGVFGGSPTGNDVLNNHIAVSGSGSTALQLAGTANETRLTNNNFSSATNVIVDDTGSGSNNRLVYNTTYTQITWDNITNISTDADLVIRSSVFVGENEAAFFSGSSEPYQVNSTAQVELRNLTYDSTVYVLRDGSRCDDTDTCNYTYTAASDSASNGTMFLNVSHFSNYSVTDTLPSSSSTPAVTTDTSSGGSGGGGGGGGSLPLSDDSESEAAAPSASSEDTASETEYTTPAAILENLEIGEFVSGDLSVPADVEGEFILIEGVLLPSEVLEPILLLPSQAARSPLVGQAGSLGAQESSDDLSSIAFAGSLSGALVPGRNSFAQSGSTVNIYYLPLKNNGDKTIRLLSELQQEQLDTSHFIVTRKQSSLIGREGISGVLLAKEASDEELLEARVLIDEIVLEPGQEKFIELRVSSGISRQEDPTLALLNLLTSQRELVTSFDVQVENKPVTLNAVSLQPESNTLDFYSMIINSDLDLAQDADYFVEVSLEEMKDSFSLFGPSVYFADLYGPYPLIAGDEYIFSQKFEYDPELYTGQMQLRMKTLIAGETILTDRFLVDFDTGVVSTLDSALSDLESTLELQEEGVTVDLDESEATDSDSAITGNLIGRVQGRQEGALDVIMLLVFVLLLLLLFLFAPRIKRLFSKKVVSSKAKLSGQDEEEHVLVSHLQSSIQEVKELRRTSKRPARAKKLGARKSSTKTVTKSSSKSSSRPRRAMKKPATKKQVAKKRVSRSRTKTQKKSTKNSSQKVRKRRR